MTNGSGSGRPKKHVDPVDGTDPDPEHCHKVFALGLCGGFRLDDDWKGK